jgi:hypothetical protein
MKRTSLGMVLGQLDGYPQADSKFQSYAFTVTGLNDLHTDSQRA